MDEEGNRIVRYEKNDLVTGLTTDGNGEAVETGLPLGSYYLKETTAGEGFVLNTEQKEFTLTAEDDTVAVVYEGVEYHNERQKIQIRVEKKDAVSGETLEGVIFGLYAGENITDAQGDVVIPKDTRIETKATGEDGTLTFDSDLCHGKYYVKEEQRLPGYLPNEEIWEIDASYGNQNESVIIFEKELKNQPTETQFTKTDIVTGVELNITNEKTPSVPQTGDNPGRPLAALALCIAAAGVFVGITIYRKKKENAEDAAKGQETDEAKEKLE